MPDKNSVQGKYQTISESEWEITMDIGPSGKAKLVHEAWLPGQKNKEVHEYNGSWTAECNGIKIKFNKSPGYFFQYHKSLSKEEAGENSSAPGFTFVGKKKNKTFQFLSGKLSFWKLDK